MQWISGPRNEFSDFGRGGWRKMGEKEQDERGRKNRVSEEEGKDG